MPKPKIFLISGLGANHLAFNRLGDVGVEKVCVNWLVNHKNESLESYALRVIAHYSISAKDYLAGLSFGGYLARTIANILDIKFVLLISSFRDKNDINPLLGFGLKTGLYRLMPQFRIPVLDQIIIYRLNSGYKGSRPVLKEMLIKTDFKIMVWSIQKMAQDTIQNTNNKTIYNIIRDNDKMVSLWTNENTYVIEKGSHFMIYEKADEVTKIIKSILGKYKS